MLQPGEVEEKEVEFNGEFIARMLPRIEWPVLVDAVTRVCVACLAS